ncbi:unnamed protein product, partial [marine sediment metagenome]
GKAGRLETQNELSKVTAGEEFARMKTQSQAQRRGEKAEDLSGLVGGLAGAGASAYGAYRQKQVSDALTKEMGMPDTFGMSPEQASIVRSHIMYGERGKEREPFRFPEGWLNFNIQDLAELAKNTGQDFEYLEWLQNKMLMEQNSSSMMNRNFYKR